MKVRCALLFCSCGREMRLRFEGHSSGTAPNSPTVGQRVWACVCGRQFSEESVQPRQVFLQRCNEAYEALRADPKAWEEEQAERKMWDATLADGLEEEESINNETRT